MEPQADAGSTMIDWGTARAAGRRLMAPAPRLSGSEIASVVADLRRFADESCAHVRAFTGMAAAGPESPVLVVDRRGWLDVNVDGFAHLAGPLLDKMAAARSGPASVLTTRVGSRVTGLELGALLAFVGSRVLGQYEPFLPAAGNGAPRPAGVDGADGGAVRGRLLLVAPNIVAVERELGVKAADFRLWVCLHEETHRTQFTAVPWLREHLAAEIHAFLTATEVDPAAVLRQLGRVASGVGDLVRGTSDTSILDLVQTPAQREILDRLTAVMSLLEGHADYVMDGVGPGVIPSVTAIRDAFAARRAAASGLEAAMRRLLGLDAKMRQYRDGERFVRAAVDAVGMAGLNRVWEAPATLPTLAELHDPPSWVRRVHGPAAVTAGR